MKSLPLAIGLSCASLLLGSCGSSPAQPETVPTPTPAPTPAPTPTPRPLTVIPACSLGVSQPGSSAVCVDPPARHTEAVHAAIDRVVRERPELFSFEDTNVGPRALDYNAYMTAVVAALGEAGLCARIDPEAEIGVKRSNSFSEQWIILTSGNYIRRKYVGSCAPATF